MVTILFRTTGLAVLAASCTASYDPVLELWPDTGSPQTPEDGTMPDIDGGDGPSDTGAGPADSGSSDMASPRTVAEGGSSSDAGPSSDAGSSNNVDSGPVSGTACSLAVTVTTVSNGGNYSPKNIGAIWIENSSRTFVKSLDVWAATRIKHLTLWNSATAAAGLPSNKVDAITGATLSTNQTHNVSWNCTNTTGAIVPDGDYYVLFEMDDDNSTGPNTSVAFTKGPTATHLTPANARNFTGISLTFTP
jgi:hypothetical protein